jgi:hypothetical protein
MRFADGKVAGFLAKHFTAKLRSLIVAPSTTDGVRRAQQLYMQEEYVEVRTCVQAAGFYAHLG